MPAAMGYLKRYILYIVQTSRESGTHVNVPPPRLGGVLNLLLVDPQE